MTSNGGDSGRASQGAIVETIRQRIVRGELSPGDRLANRRELVIEFQASSVTIQRAMDRLIADGFIWTDGPNGTFVARNPPHTCRYGLLMKSHPRDGERWRRFDAVLCNAARDMSRLPERSVVVYYDIDGTEEGDDYRQLLNDLQSQRLAGLIIKGEPAPLFGSPVLSPEGPPRVALAEEPSGPGIPAVGHDRYAFINQSLDYLKQRGRHRVAFIGGERVAPANLFQYLQSAMEARGMTYRPYWWQRTFVGHPELAKGVVHLLMHEGQDVRPDGLIIYDDNLLDDVISGVLQAGASIPRDLDLVSHCNFPWSMPTAVPVKRIGYDANETLQLCLDLIDRQRRGQPVEVMTQIRPMADEQFEAAEHVSRRAQESLVLVATT